MIKTKLTRDSFHVFQANARNALKQSEQASSILIRAGTGCIGLTIAHEVNDARAVLMDISDAALSVERENARRLGVHDRTIVMRGDALKPPVSGLGQFHVMTCNPPYITGEEMGALDRSVAAYEPHLALYGGADGLDFYRAITENYKLALKDGGYLCYEFGEEQGDSICQILEENGFTIVERTKDFNDTERAVIARYDRKDD